MRKVLSIAFALGANDGLTTYAQARQKGSEGKSWPAELDGLPMQE